MPEKPWRQGQKRGSRCSWLKETYDPSKVLHWGGWGRPETKGRTYAQNPLHPEVREFYLKYIRALLDEHGREVDGFIWDETFVVGPNELGPEAALGYASRAIMTLMKEVAAEVARFSLQLAFFASDDIGAARQFEQAAPYCLVAHGTYQDSWCSPSAWPYGLFPNYRNVLCSHNWAPVTRFEYSRYGVETFAVPVPISVAYVGDNISIGDMTVEQQKKIMDLFNKRKQERMEICWVEEEPWSPKYQGKEVANRKTSGGFAHGSQPAVHLANLLRQSVYSCLRLPGGFRLVSLVHESRDSQGFRGRLKSTNSQDWCDFRVFPVGLLNNVRTLWASGSQKSCRRIWSRKSRWKKPFGDHPTGCSEGLLETGNWRSS